MVISLESQNVKVKRQSYSPFRKYHIQDIQLPQISFSIIPAFDKAPYFLSIILFLILFSNMNIFLIPKSNSVINLDKVILPESSAELISRNMIESYESNIKNSYFYATRLYEGDTLSSLSVKYGVSRNTILNYNGITDVRKLGELKQIVIPAVNGFRHRVTTTDTLEGLSLKYNVPVKDIFIVNSMKSESLAGLDTIYIPYTDPDKWGWKSNIGRFFVYPLSGYISNRYGFFTNDITGITSLYEGIDMTPIADLSVTASKTGVVSLTGYSANYGNYIYIDHTGGIRTLYAHLEKISVSKGQRVSQGDIIGIAGESGFTDSRKLFFSIFYKDKSVDPENFLN